MKQDDKELKRQERTFLWGLVGFVCISCIGAIAFLLSQRPDPDDRKDSPIPPNDRIVERLAKENVDREKASQALEQLASLARECQSLDTEVLNLLREALKNPSERRLDQEMLDDLRELEKRRADRAARLAELLFDGISSPEAQKLEAERNQARELNAKADAFIKRLKSRLEIDK